MKKTKLVIVALFAALAVALVTGCQNTASGANENSGTTTQTGGNTSGGTTQTGGKTSGGTTQTGGNTSGGTTPTGGNSGSGTWTTTPILAGCTYKTSSARMGETQDAMDEGVDKDNYVTMTFAATGNTINVVGTGPSFSQGFTGTWNYTLEGTTIAVTFNGASMNGTVSADGTTISFPAQQAGGYWLSATYVKQ